MSYFSQGSAATFFRWGGRVSNNLLKNFLVIKSYWNWFIFCGVIQNIKGRGRFWDTV